MGAEPERTRAADDKSEEHFQRYHPVAPLGGIPLIVVYWLMEHHKLEQLPLALQWILVVLVFLGVLFTIVAIVLPRWRRFWVRPSRNWWGAFVVAFNTLIIALIVTTGFAIVSTFLYLQGMATTSPEHPLTTLANDSMEYYLWNFLHSIPVLELPQALGWEEPPFRYTDHVSRLLLLIYQIVLIGPVIATIVLSWREVRHVRDETKDPA